MGEERTLPDPGRLSGPLAAVGITAEKIAAARAAGIMPAIRGDDDDLEPVCRRCSGNRWLKRKKLRQSLIGGGPNARQLEQDIEPCPSCCPHPSREEMIQAACLFPVKTFGEWEPEPALSRAVLACHELVDSRGRERWCVFMRGGTGRGKTHLATASGITWIDNGFGRVIFVGAADLLDRLRETQHEGAAEKLTDLVAMYADVPLLIIDDLGVDRPTPFASEQLYKVIDRREKRQAPLIVTSNVRPSDENEAIGERILSRLAQGEIVIAGGTDYRRRR